MTDTTPTPAQADEKALERAVDAFLACRPKPRVAVCDFGEEQRDILRQQLTAALAALRPEGEAVAWRQKFKSDPWIYHHAGWPYAESERAAGAIVEPLFASPPAPAAVKVVDEVCQRLHAAAGVIGPLAAGRMRSEIAEATAVLRSSLLPPSTEAQAATPAEALPSQTSGVEAVAFDPLKGGCPHCQWLDTNLGRVLDKKCDLHQKIEDILADRALDRSIIKEQGDLIRRVSEAIGANEDDDPVKLATERMGGIAELEAALAKPASEPAGGGVRTWKGEPVEFPSDGELASIEDSEKVSAFETWARKASLRLHMAESGLGRFYEDDRTEWAWQSWLAALSSPSSSPAEAVKMRPETTSEHIARDIKEGRFPERSEPRMVPAEAEALPDGVEAAAEVHYERVRLRVGARPDGTMIMPTWADASPANKANQIEDIRAIAAALSEGRGDGE